LSTMSENAPAFETMEEGVERLMTSGSMAHLVAPASVVPAPSAVSDEEAKEEEAKDDSDDDPVIGGGAGDTESDVDPAIGAEEEEVEGDNVGTEAALVPLPAAVVPGAEIVTVAGPVPQLYVPPLDPLLGRVFRFPRSVAEPPPTGTRIPGVLTAEQTAARQVLAEKKQVEAAQDELEDDATSCPWYSCMALWMWEVVVTWMLLTDPEQSEEEIREYLSQLVYDQNRDMILNKKGDRVCQGAVHVLTDMMRSYTGESDASVWRRLQGNNPLDAVRPPRRRGKHTRSRVVKTPAAKKRRVSMTSMLQDDTRWVVEDSDTDEEDDADTDQEGETEEKGVPAPGTEEGDKKPASKYKQRDASD
jgi:hypothetical protein